MPSYTTMMYEHALEAVKGYFHLGALDKAAPLAASVLESVAYVPAGRVAHLNADGEFELGGSGTQMPIFLWQGSHALDVANYGVSDSGTTNWVSILPGGTMHGLVATGGYELQTTEFDATRTYSINDPLTASATGVLTNNCTVYSNWICGICSSFCLGDPQAVGLGQVPAPSGPVGYNAHGVKVLTFWSYFLPPLPSPE